jgi:hypothetical protein
MTVEKCTTGSELKRVMDQAIRDQVIAGQMNTDPNRSATEHEQRLNQAKEAAFESEKEFVEHRKCCAVCRRSDD